MEQHWQPGAHVILRSNPFHGTVVDIVGTVLAYRAGAGFAGCDLLDVEYVHPDDGLTYVRPFGLHHLSPGSPDVLLQMAQRYEALAAELRRLAGSDQWTGYSDRDDGEIQPSSK